MEKYLNEFVPGETGKVLSVKAEGKLRRRLFDMGVTPNVEITLAQDRADGGSHRSHDPRI